MATFLCTDGYIDDAIEIEAETARKAAQAYVDGGDWGEHDSTTWVLVRVAPIDDPDNSQRIRIAIHPAEPDCTEPEHDWKSPYSVVGGIESNPGVHGHGGGVVITEVCTRCGAYKETDTWAQDPDTGEEGLTSISYRDSDAISEEWVVSLTETAEDEDAD